MARLGSKRGNTILEFALAGAPMIFLCVGVASLSLGMWTYHSMAYAVSATARALAVRGAGCTGSCVMTVDDTAKLIAAKATGVPPAALNVTLLANATGGSPATQTCEPLTACLGNTDRWPPAGSNAAGMNLRVTARYAIPLPGMYWPGAAKLGAAANVLGASAQEPVQF